MDNGEQGSDRRTSSRVDAIVIVSLGDRRRHAISRNVSDHGLLLATRSKLHVGDELEIAIVGRNGPVPTKGRVVRVDEPPGAEWRYLVAMELDISIPRDILEDGAQASARLMRSKPAG